MIKKDIETVNLKRAIRVHGLYSQVFKSNKPGEIDDEGMVLFLNRNTKKATGYYYTSKVHDEFNEKDQQKNIMLN